MVNQQIACVDSLSCSWASSIPNQTIVIGHENDPQEWDEDKGIVHVISEENFVFLDKVNDEPCIISVKLNDPYTQITNISVVSEARILEIYGKYGEYIKTCKCEHISEVNGADVYGTQTDLLTTQEITIKFPSVKTGIWLYGIKVLVKNISPSIRGSFDYNLVDDKLKRSNVPITEKAEQFKKFLQDYAATKYPSTNVDPHALIKIMEGECLSHLRPVESAGRNISTYLSNLIPSTLKTNGIHNNVYSSDTETEKINKNIEGEAQSSIKDYVDERIQKLEERLEDNFKKQLQELEAKQNDKLDTILSLLKNSAVS